jgi:hypothetical protein
MKEEQAAAAMQWDELQGHYYQKIQQIKTRSKRRKKPVRPRAEAAKMLEVCHCSNRFAMLADEVEVAALEAIDGSLRDSVTELGVDRLLLQFHWDR